MIRRVIFLGVVLTLFYVFILSFVGFVRDANASILKPPPLGISDDNAALSGVFTVDYALDKTKPIKPKSYTIKVRGTYGLDKYDEGIYELKAKHMKIHIVLTDYTSEDFVYQAVRRWPFVHQWSLWSEPEIRRTNPAMEIGWKKYQAVHKAGYKIIKAHNRHDKVMIGEVVVYDPQMIKTLAKLPGDGFAIHPYSGRSPWETRNVTMEDGKTGKTISVGLLKYVRKVIHRPIYVTEFGYKTKYQHWMGLALKIAKKAHVKEFTLYQIIPDPYSHWNTMLTSIGIKSIRKAFPKYYRVHKKHHHKHHKHHKRR